MTKLLLIAPLGSGASATNVIGGHTVQAVEAVRELGQRGFELEVLDTSGDVTNISRWRFHVSRLARFLRVIRGVVTKIRRSEGVFLVTAPGSALVLASSVWAICRMTRRPLVLRLSGGDLSLVFHGYGAVARWLAARAWMRCSLVYVETWQAYRDFDHLPNFRWLPGTRNVQAPARIRREEVRKLIFVSRLHMDKGLAEVLDACRHLPERCHLHVFGPGMSDTDWSLFETHPRATYGGVLEPEDVPRVLSEHDLLLFPSYYSGEGHPGVILEAFQCGLPVIAAKWRAVPEIVGHEEHGLLVEPRSAGAVRSAIERLLDDPDLYRRLCKGAERRGEDFRSAKWHDRLVTDLRAGLGLGAIVTPAAPQAASARCRAQSAAGALPARGAPPGGGGGRPAAVETQSATCPTR